jgi:hypothetical protein
MHAKYMHKLCSLLMHIPTYYNVISRYNHDLQCLWGFSIDPRIFGITLQNRKTMFCVFLRFRNLPKLKLIWDFLCVNILSREPSRAQEVNEGGHEAQKSTGGVAPSPGRATHAQMNIEAPMPSIFISWCSTWPKYIYIKTPLMFLRGGGRET